MAYPKAGFPRLAILAVAAIAFGAPASLFPADSKVQAAVTGSQYVIGPGDVLQITVWREPEASVPSVVVRSDGVISLPLVKEVQASGLTPQNLERALTEKLKQLIREADVTVVVREIHSERVFLIGAIRKQGPVVMPGRLTVLQAVAEAGGFTDYAKRQKIYVLRQEGGSQIRIPFDYQTVTKAQQSDKNFALRPGDTVVVP